MVCVALAEQFVEVVDDAERRDDAFLAALDGAASRHPFDRSRLVDCAHLLASRRRHHLERLSPLIRHGRRRQQE